MAAIPAALNTVQCPALTGALVVVAVPLLDDGEEVEEEELVVLLVLDESSWEL